MVAFSEDITMALKRFEITEFAQKQLSIMSILSWEPKIALSRLTSISASLNSTTTSY